MTTQRCKALTQNGLRCRNPTLDDSDYYRRHQGWTPTGAANGAGFHLMLEMRPCSFHLALHDRSAM